MRSRCPQVPQKFVDRKSRFRRPSVSRRTCPPSICALRSAPRRQGVMPDGTSRFSLDGKKPHHYMGCSTFANFTVLPEIAVAKIRSDVSSIKIDRVVSVSVKRIGRGVGSIHLRNYDEEQPLCTSINGAVGQHSPALRCPKGGRRELRLSSRNSC